MGYIPGVNLATAVMALKDTLSSLAGDAILNDLTINVFINDIFSHMGSAWIGTAAAYFATMIADRKQCLSEFDKVMNAIEL